MDLCGKAKAQTYNTCAAPQAAYRSCSGAVQVWPTTNQPYAALVCRLMVSTPVIHVITSITTHLLTPKGWKA